jgi:predicted enzyme related to lactoylglutathione lyase
MKRPVHFEILADDPQRVAAFYEVALDWQIARW